MYCILVTGIPAAGKSTMAKNDSRKVQAAHYFKGCNERNSV